MTDIELVEDGSIGYIWLNRPKALNALSDEMRAGLIAILDELEGNERIKVAVLSGRGRAFCAGGDVKGQQERAGKLGASERMTRHRRRALPCAVRVLDFSKPIVAAINGPAVGAGFHLALACDVRIASSDAYFSEAFVDRGLVPDWLGLRMVPEFLGLSRAIEMVITGRRMYTEEARNIGLLADVVEGPELNQHATALATLLANKAPIAVSLAKQLMKKAIMPDVWAAGETEVLAQTICAMSSDHIEGVRAFTEKRDPNFTGA